jgi:hypothetical protein
MQKWINQKRSDDFIKMLWAAHEMELQIWGIYAHAAYLNNFFKEVAGWNNYFRFRPRTPQEPGSVILPENGEPTRYMDWKTGDECMIFYLEVVRRQYPAAFKAKNPYAYIKGLKGWMDDKNFDVSKVISLYEFVRQEDEVWGSFYSFLTLRKK